MRYRFYTTSSTAWSAMLDAIHRAREFVYLESFIFYNDTFPTHDFVGELTAKARQGIRVILVVDRSGSVGLPAHVEDELRASGVELLFFTHWFRRIHRKVLVVDGVTGFLGGVNIGAKYRHWLDLHVQISAPSVVRALMRSFALSYRLSGGTDVRVLDLEKRMKMSRRARIWLLEHSPISGKRSLRGFYEKAFARAEQSITIVTPYFLPHRWFERALLSAVRRGVRVEVLLPRATSPALGTIANLFFATAFYKQGVRFYFTPMMNHAKVLLVDGKTALVGSQNIDARSFDFNDEVGVAFRQKKMVADLRDIIAQWKLGAEEFTHYSLRRRWYHGPLELLVWMLQPLL